MAVDDSHGGRGHEHPGQLVPVEEGKAEERRGEPAVERGEEKAGVGQKKEKKPFAAALRGYLAGLLHGGRIDHWRELFVSQRRELGLE